MPSPFPGMDPFLEGQLWRDFHHAAITAMREALVPRLVPRYVVEVQEWIYLERADDDGAQPLGPAVFERHAEGLAPATAPWSASAEVGAAIAVAPRILTLPHTPRVAQGYLEIRRRGSAEVITIIELLSPTNKSSRGGHQEYLAKRATLLETSASLVEVDLLRGGTRLPTVEPLPAGDFYAYVSRGTQRPRVEVYHWFLRDRLPDVAIPLAEGDADVLLSLASTLTTVYDRSGYEYLVDHTRNVEPPLNEDDMRWTQEILRQPRD